MLRDDVGRLAQLHRGLGFPFGSDDLRATLALGLGFLCHGALHIVGKYNVFDFDRRHLRAPRLRVPVDDVLDLLVDACGVRKKLIEAESSDDIAHSSLADLINRIVDILNHDHRFFRIGNMIVSDRCDVDRDVTFVMIFCEGICIVTVRKDTRTICWMGTKMSVSPGPRTPSNFPRRNTTPRSYCRSTRSEPMRYKITAIPRITRI